MRKSSFGRFFSGTFLSRISGLGRDLALAYSFGDHPAVAGFMVAFRFSHLMRRFFGEGPLQSAFIPHFEGLRVQDHTRASDFFRKLSFFLFLLLVGVVALTEAGLYVLPKCLLCSVDVCYILELTRTMAPSLIFICLYGLNISLLQCHEHFFLSSIGPFISNLFWIVGALLLKGGEPVHAMAGLSKIVALGFIAQWLFTMPKTLACVGGGMKQWFSQISFRVPQEVKELARTFGLGALGVGAMQLSAFFDSLFARAADLKGPVYLWYSIRIEQMFFALFGMASVSTLVPLFSRTIKAGDMQKAEELFSEGLFRIYGVLIPATCILFTMGASAINLLFGKGSFSQEAVAKTTQCLWAYSLSLIPATLVLWYSSLFYAWKDFRTPTLASLTSVGFSLAFNTFFVFTLKWGALSIALTTALSSLVNALLLHYLLHKRAVSVPRGLWHQGINVLCCLIAMIATSVFETYCFSSTTLSLLWGSEVLFPRTLIQQLVHFVCLLCCFLLTFLGTLWLFGGKKLLMLYGELLGRKQLLSEKV